MTDQTKLALRLAALAFGTVVIQQAAVSQISIFGVTADLGPLVVMSVGLLMGSLPGAVAGAAFLQWVPQILRQHPLQLLMLPAGNVRLPRCQQQRDQLTVGSLVERVGVDSSPGPLDGLEEISRLLGVVD